MSFLQPASSATLHRPRDDHDDTLKRSQQRPPRQLRKATSTASFLSPLADLARHPTRPLESVWNAFRGTAIGERRDEEEKGEKSQILYLRMKEAKNYDEWRDAACELDVLEGNEDWKQETESAEYDVALVQARLKQLDDARISCDVKKMLFLVRTSLTRGLGGMGDLRLYKHSHVGTKSLIERYIESAQATLRTLLELSDKQPDVEPRYILDQLLETRQAFGRSALLLSGGGTYGMNHIGVIKSLWEAKLLPRIISGSSAGSIVCAVLCSKTDDEIPGVMDDFCNGDLAVFGGEADEGILEMTTRFLKHGSIFDISHLVRVMRGLMGDMTFQEAYNRTRRILNISVSSESIHELPRLLNYITAPNVMIWSAVAASCSVPIVFSPAQLLAKDPRTGETVPWYPSPQRYIDGSVDGDIPMTRLAEMFNVNHFIVSQVNPHVVPFLSRDDEKISAAAANKADIPAGPGWMHTMAHLARGEALHRMQVLAECGVFPTYFTKMQSILSQKYSGDITILPEILWENFPKILKNPTTDFMVQAMLCGEKATWPKLSRVKNHCAIELALDHTIRQLRSRVVFSRSQVDLRLNTIGVHGQGNDKSTLGHKRGARSVRIGDRNANSYIEPDASYSPPPRPRSLFEGEPSQPTQRKRDGPPRRPIPRTSQSFLQPNSQYASSSAEDEQPEPRLFTDNTSDNDSYSSDDLDDGHRPELWPSTRQLFPSASQPATPFFSSRLANSSGSLAMTPRIVVPGAETTPTGPSTPELKYKRLFHGSSSNIMNPRTSDSHASTAGTLDGEFDADADGDLVMIDRPRSRRGSTAYDLQMQGPKSRRESENKNLTVDISGTRGMLLRMKRSMSTGVKGLKPPSQH